MQQSNPSHDKRDEQIAQLKAELERAYNIINQLQNQSENFENNNGQLSAHLEHETSRLYSLSQQAHNNTRYTSKQSFKKLSNLQFLILTTVVATGLSITALVATYLTTPRSKEVPAKPSTETNFSPISAPQPKWAITKSLSVPLREANKDNSKIIYNVQTAPIFKQSQELQSIVDEVVSLTTARGLPEQPLSITLTDVKTGETSGHQQEVLRFPASVVKMFWMVVLYAQIEKGIWKNEDIFNPYIAKMIEESDNEAASYIIDQITNAQSVSELKGQEFESWQSQRKELNTFFKEAGYKNINISQKTFPLPYLKLSKPQGTDLQLRQNPNNPSKPIRNKISTEQAARLIYETCYTGQAVSPEASLKMCKWLKRDLYSEVWLKEPPNTNIFNPIKAFFGESFARTDIKLYSKAGWTSGSRQETALISTSDGKSMYILSIFGDDSAYANDYKIFPRIAGLVHKRMINRSAVK